MERKIERQTRDVRMLFQSDNPDVPRGYEDVQFYFW
jgi:hypothetical protein